MYPNPSSQRLDVYQITVHDDVRDLLPPAYVNVVPPVPPGDLHRATAMIRQVVDGCRSLGPETTASRVQRTVLNLLPRVVSHAGDFQRWLNGAPEFAHIPGRSLVGEVFMHPTVSAYVSTVIDGVRERFPNTNRYTDDLRRLGRGLSDGATLDPLVLERPFRPSTAQPVRPGSYGRAQAARVIEATVRSCAAIDGSQTAAQWIERLESTIPRMLEWAPVITSWLRGNENADLPGQEVVAAALRDPSTWNYWERAVETTKAVHGGRLPGYVAMLDNLSHALSCAPFVARDTRNIDSIVDRLVKTAAVVPRRPNPAKVDTRVVAFVDTLTDDAERLSTWLRDTPKTDSRLTIVIEALERTPVQEEVQRRFDTLISRTYRPEPGELGIREASRLGSALAARLPASYADPSPQLFASQLPSAGRV